MLEDWVDESWWGAVVRMDELVVEDDWGGLGEGG